MATWALGIFGFVLLVQIRRTYLSWHAIGIAYPCLQPTTKDTEVDLLVRPLHGTCKQFLHRTCLLVHLALCVCSWTRFAGVRILYVGNRCIRH